MAPVRPKEGSMSKPSHSAGILNRTDRGKGQTGLRTFRLAVGVPLYFSTTLAPKKSGRPADGPEILTPQWLRQYGSPILYLPASEARDHLERLTSQQFGRWATASRPRLLRFLTTRDLTVLDCASIPEGPMNLNLLSAQGVSRKEVLVSDLGLNGFVTDLRAGRPNGLPACLLFELMDPVGSLELKSVLNFPHPLTAQNVADPDDYSRWLADDPALPPPESFEIGPGDA
jgi:hypothetical protein